MRRRIQSQAIQVNFVFPIEKEFSNQEEERAVCMQLMPLLVKLDYRKANFN